MNPRINFPNLVRQLLPQYKRQPVRLMLLKVFAGPLVQLFMSFDKWRDQVRIEINMTGQVGVLEGYLRAKYKDSRIRIATFSDRGLQVGLLHEGQTNAVPVGLGTTDPEKAFRASVPLPGELREQFGDADFIVYLPAGCDDTTKEAIRIDINRYKHILVTYKIIDK